MKKNVAFMAFATFLGLSSTSHISHAADLGSSPAVLPHPQTLEAEVLRFEGNYYVVKDSTGKEVRLYTDKTTKIDGNLSPGDKIVARTAAVPSDALPYATFITKLGSPQLVEGRIVAMEKGYYVLKDVQGQEVRVYVDSGTSTDSPLSIGDRVVIHTAKIPDAYADSITKH